MASYEAYIARRLPLIHILIYGTVFFHTRCDFDNDWQILILAPRIGSN